MSENENVILLTKEVDAADNSLTPGIKTIVEREDESDFEMSDDSAADAQDFLGDDLHKSMHMESQESASSYSSTGVDIKPDKVGEKVAEALSTIPTPTNCQCNSHDGRQILNATFFVDVEAAFKLIFTDSPFIRILHETRKTFDISISEWQQLSNQTPSTNSDSSSENNEAASKNKDQKSIQIRQLTYTVTINHTLVKHAPTSETQLLLHSQSGAVYVVRSDAVNIGIPYADSYYVRSQWCLTREADQITRIQVHTSVIFKKSAWGLNLMKAVIEKSAFQGVTDFCTDLSSTLPRWLLERNSIDSARRSGDCLSIKSNNSLINGHNGNTADIISPSDSISLAQYANDRSSSLGSGTTRSTGRVGILSNLVSHSASDEVFMLRVILVILFLLLLLNCILFLRLWQIESVTEEFDDIDLAVVQGPVELRKWRTVIQNAIKITKSIETNLYELHENFKDEL